jgi:hypothetical protein
MVMGECIVPAGITRYRPAPCAVEAAHIYPVCSADIAKAESMKDHLQTPEVVLGVKSSASQKVEVSSGRNVLFLYFPIAKWFDEYKVSVTVTTGMHIPPILVLVVLDKQMMNESIHLAPGDKLMEGWDLPDVRTFEYLHMHELTIPAGTMPCLRFLSSHFRHAMSLHPAFTLEGVLQWDLLADLSETHSEAHSDHDDEDAEKKTEDEEKQKEGRKGAQEAQPKTTTTRRGKRKRKRR